MNISLTNHAFERISKRVGLKSEAAAIEFGKKALEKGKLIFLKRGSIHVLYRGYSLLFSITKNKKAEKTALLITVIIGTEVHKGIKKQKNTRKQKYFDSCYDQEDEWLEAA